MGKKVTFSEGAELLGVPISTISKWFSQGLFNNVELDRKGPGGGTYYLRLEELLAIKDALEAEAQGLQLAEQEIAAAQEEKYEDKRVESKEKNVDEISSKRRLSLVKSGGKNNNVLENPDNNPGKEIVLRIQEDTAAGLINTLSNYLNNFEQKFLQHMEAQADKNAVKYNSMAIEHLETLKDMSAKMEKVVDALLTMPDKVSQDTAKVVQEIKEALPDMSQFSETKTNEKLEAVGKKLERLSEEIKDTKWAVVKMARESTKNGKVVKTKNKKKLGLGFGIGKIFGFGK